MKDRDDERRSLLIETWLERRPEQRTDDHLMAFFEWVGEHRPDLMKPGAGDAYQCLRDDLRGYIVEK